MKFLFLTQYFAPEFGAAPVRLAAIIRQLRHLGHDIEVVTAMPNYPVARIFDGYRGKFYSSETWEGIRVHRLWLYAAVGKGWRRYLNYATFTLASLFGLIKAGKADCLFVESPPLSLSVPAFLYSRFRRVPFVFYVADLWPDAVCDNLGLNRDGLTLQFARALERWSYRKAEYVCAVTEGILADLQHRGVPQRKLLFLPNGVDPDLFAPMPPDERLRRELGLQNKDIILYAGTHGYAHGVDRILQAAKILQERRPDCHFVFVGDGSAKPMLMHMAKELGISNVSFLNPVPPEQVGKLFSIALCGLVSLNESSISEHTRPAKSLTAMSCGRPVVYIGSGEGSRLVKNAKAGLVLEEGDPNAVADAICRLAADPELAANLGPNGRKFVEEHLPWSLLVRRWLHDLTRRMQLSHTEVQHQFGAAKS
ncbi:MAG: glycosyltransferase WbuB [Acidobacteria bacterium]|nr:MAG: glycosyltransferase WbuB [Acidobacteriota bacterium]